MHGKIDMTDIARVRHAGGEATGYCRVYSSNARLATPPGRLHLVVDLCLGVIPVIMDVRGVSLLGIIHNKNKKSGPKWVFYYT